MILMKTTFLDFANESHYSINLTMNDSPFSLDFSIPDNKLDTDAGHWYLGEGIKHYVIS